MQAVGPMVAGLREVKDADEIQRLRRAALVGCGLFDGMLTYLEPGLRELEVAADAGIRCAAGWGGGNVVRDDRCERGALGAAAWAGYELGEAAKRGFVTLDFGVILDGYCSDMTRTVHLGKATAW